jgi:hypothetical protein
LQANTTLKPPVITDEQIAHEYTEITGFSPELLPVNGLRDFAKRILALNNVQWSEMLAGQEPCAWQCRFKENAAWSDCSKEHHDWVKRCPHEFVGYEARALYTAIVPSHDRAMLIEARQALGGGLWDHGPGQDEHEACQALIDRIDAHIAGAPVPAQAPAVAVPEGSPVGDWTYSHDEERFHGQFATRDEAAAGAASCGARFVGKIRHARDIIDDERIGSDIGERISEIIGEEVGEVAEFFALSSDQEAELGKLVLDWIEAGPGFNCWGVDDIEDITAAQAGEGGGK